VAGPLDPKKVVSSEEIATSDIYVIEGLFRRGLFNKRTPD